MTALSYTQVVHVARDLATQYTTQADVVLAVISSCCHVTRVSATHYHSGSRLTIGRFPYDFSMTVWISKQPPGKQHPVHRAGDDIAKRSEWTINEVYCMT